MNRPWTAEQEVSPELAQTLIAQQFPQLAPVQIDWLGTGWDNIAYRVNRDYVFRFPRRKIAVELIEREARLLPLIAPYVPLSIPEPMFVGAPSELYAWPWLGYRLIVGRTACAAAFGERQRLAAAPVVAKFLKALHAMPVDDFVRQGIGGDPLHRLDITVRRVKIEQLVAQALQQQLIANPEPWLRAMEVVQSLPLARPAVVVHGDFYARHLLVDEAGCFSGVIDWGDVHLGHAALDLAIAHSFLPPEAHDVFRQNYGAIDDASWQWARYRALEVSLLLLVYGYETNDTHLTREARTSLSYLAE